MTPRQVNKLSSDGLYMGNFNIFFSRDDMLKKLNLV